MMDIAKMSGVSIATVSRVLNQNGRYSAETAKRVMDIVKKYNYTINPNAQGLRTNHTNTVGVIIPDITNEYFAQIVRAIEHELMKSGYNVFVCDSNEDIKFEDYHINSLQTKGVDGIIYISTRRSVDDIEKDFTVPVVYIDRGPGINSNLVASDNLMGGFLATEELIKKGCRKILMIKDTNEFNTVNDRMNGYLEAHKRYNIPIESERIINCKVSYEDACETIKKVIDKEIEFDAVFCNTDTMALGVLRGLKDRGRRVPEDVKLVGFDGIRSAEISDPPITTVVQNTEKIGQKSVEILMQMIVDKIKKTPEFIIPVELSVRESTKNT